MERKYKSGKYVDTYNCQSARKTKQVSLLLATKVYTRSSNFDLDDNNKTHFLLCYGHLRNWDGKDFYSLLLAQSE